MSTNTYANKTIFETFQTLGYGDRIWPDVETENWQNVENKLLAINSYNFIVNHGNFAFPSTLPPSGMATITLTASGGSSFEGSIGRNYYKISKTGSSTLTWDFQMTTDGVWYLYLNSVTGATDPSDASSLSTEAAFSSDGTAPYSLSDSDNRFLMAIVTVLSGTVTLNHSPSSQLSYNSFSSHLLVSTNPHGSVLTQTRIVNDTLASNSASVGSLTAATADITSLSIGSVAFGKEYFYSFSIGPSTTSLQDLNVLLSTPFVENVIKFISFSARTTSEKPIWFEYGTGNLYQFTVHNENITTVSGVLFVKYITN